MDSMGGFVLEKTRWLRRSRSSNGSPIATTLLSMFLMIGKRNGAKCLRWTSANAKSVKRAVDIAERQWCITSSICVTGQTSHYLCGKFSLMEQRRGSLYHCAMTATQQNIRSS